MHRNEDVMKERHTTKILLKLCCTLGILIIVFFLVPLFIWSYANKNPEVNQLEHSMSPNQNNEIEIVKIDEFPDPIIRINYADQSIMKTKIPHDIIVDWISEYEAIITLKRSGREPDIVVVEFEK